MSGFDSMSGFNILSAIFPVFFIAVFAFIVVMIVKSISREAADRNAPRIEGRGAVVAKRAQVGGTQSGTSTEYFVTVEAEDGVRTELRTAAALYGMIAEGDRGVFVRQGSRLVDFAREGAAASAKEEDVSGWHRCSGCGATFKGERCDYCGTPWKIDK
jgi:hypothetical protein